MEGDSQKHSEDSTKPKRNILDYLNSEEYQQRKKEITKETTKYEFNPKADYISFDDEDKQITMEYYSELMHEAMEKIKCPYCKGNHWLTGCEKYKKDPKYCTFCKTDTHNTNFCFEARMKPMYDLIDRVIQKSRNLDDSFTDIIEELKVNNPLKDYEDAITEEERECMVCLRCGKKGHYYCLKNTNKYNKFFLFEHEVDTYEDFLKERREERKRRQEREKMKAEELE
ncbi:MAG: hypothetical protein MJ252_28485, partial [archaeon]|nr:hypothetical protein [archaeon]